MRPARDVVDAHRRVGGVDRLPARAARTHDVDLEVLRVDVDLDVLDLGHHRDGRGRGVDAPLRLGRRHALHAVHARFVLELRVRALARDAGRHFLDAARRRARHRQDLDLPAPPLGEAGVHAEQIGREQRRFFAARAGADLEDDVLVVVGILGHEQHFERLLQPLLLGGELGLFLARQVAHLGILLQLARFGRRACATSRCSRSVSTSSRRSACSLPSFCICWRFASTAGSASRIDSSS